MKEGDIVDRRKKAYSSVAFSYSEETMFDCTPDAIHCENPYGDCIPSYWRCDGIVDCKGSEDENDCPSTYSSMYEYSDETMFECTDNAIHCENAYGDCIPEYWRCDYIIDCNDGQDETGCEDEKRMLQARLVLLLDTGNMNAMVAE
ncbi:sortilin-related receptor-like [Patiria miniata]|uniref:Uncharacterized protein n=1 Tax=Patiria miniata TaxID=46514 RepID=A0A914ARV9_PATMI|nr:sortilin-related receptor-like [Patiria miniata]